ncbi:hypothetical protein HFD88_003169 [Aspergillus terreus]|nr:hypothetical protein HFD88_003169 [Aspergillus terreus]
MQLTKFLLALVATSAVALALPQSNTCDSAIDCGSCYGSSCNIGLINYDCEHGTSCLASHGGGDGKKCSGGYDGGAICPGKA